MHIAIRPYRESEIDAVILIWREGQESAGVRSPDTPDDLHERWTSQRSLGRGAYVADIDGAIVGFITFQDGEVKQLYVSPGHQGRGIGKRLLDFAKSQMPGGFHLNTAIESRAPRFYEREGLVRGKTGIHARYGHRTIQFTWTPG